jgi:hypothetical protein
MGTLVYGDSQFDLELDDRLLAHLQIVIGAKLRRDESFYFTWISDEDSGGLRNTIWLHPSISLRYHYSQPGRQAINREWLESLSVSANSAGGLLPSPEFAAGESTRAETHVA